MESKPAPHARGPRTEGERPGSPSPERDEKAQIGLCVNCVNRDTCLLPRSEGGVWHCEEYMEEH